MCRRVESSEFVEGRESLENHSHARRSGALRPEHAARGDEALRRGCQSHRFGCGRGLSTLPRSWKHGVPPLSEGFQGEHRCPRRSSNGRRCAATEAARGVERGVPEAEAPHSGQERIELSPGLPHEPAQNLHECLDPFLGAEWIRAELHECAHKCFYELWGALASEALTSTPTQTQEWHRRRAPRLQRRKCRPNSGLQRSCHYNPPNPLLSLPRAHENPLECPTRLPQ
mmetsp:Transcript_31225/g.101826  ORF Transcript_31225/g.101826 Transcript_31225/m.101826 type:complete len:228 (+) Transcript_31225:153-836(+)